ncbi:MAG TPA: WbqC family protein [Candidatus Binatia bacterium]|nr:WbqC family protein [Candidatus Binatia bacterium]
MTAHRTIAIMQPTYLPWLGYFDLMDQVDAFVLLDHVQFERASWQQRNRVKGPGGAVTLTVPVRHTGRATRLADAEIAAPGFARAHRRTIEVGYGRAPGFARHRGALAALYGTVPPRLVAFSEALIVWLRAALGVCTPLLRASALGVDGAKDGLMRRICEALGATRYLAAPGSRAYMEAGGAFADGRVAVAYHAYACVPYAQQHGPFVPQLSALDCVLNLGDGARAAMLAGRLPPVP